MRFEIVSEIVDVETIAAGTGIRSITRLRKAYGPGRLPDGKICLAEIRWYESTPSAAKTTRSSSSFEGGEYDNATIRTARRVPRQRGQCRLVGTEEDLHRLPDPDAEKHGLLRVIDESGEDYLYPTASFGLITLPAPLKKAVLAA